MNSKQKHHSYLRRSTGTAKSLDGLIRKFNCSISSMGDANDNDPISEKHRSRRSVSSGLRKGVRLSDSFSKLLVTQQPQQPQRPQQPQQPQQPQEPQEPQQPQQPQKTQQPQQTQAPPPSQQQQQKQKLQQYKSIEHERKHHQQQPVRLQHQTSEIFYDDGELFLRPSMSTSSSSPMLITFLPQQDKNDKNINHNKSQNNYTDNVNDQANKGLYNSCIEPAESYDYFDYYNQKDFENYYRSPLIPPNGEGGNSYYNSIQLEPSSGEVELSLTIHNHDNCDLAITDKSTRSSSTGSTCSLVGGREMYDSNNNNYNMGKGGGFIATALHHMRKRTRSTRSLSGSIRQEKRTRRSATFQKNTRMWKTKKTHSSKNKNKNNNNRIHFLEHWGGGVGKSNKKNDRKYCSSTSGNGIHHCNNISHRSPEDDSSTIYFDHPTTEIKLMMSPMTPKHLARNLSAVEICGGGTPHTVIESSFVYPSSSDDAGEDTDNDANEAHHLDSESSSSHCNSSISHVDNNNGDKSCANLTLLQFDPTKTGNLKVESLDESGSLLHRKVIRHNDYKCNNDAIGGPILDEQQQQVVQQCKQQQEQSQQQKDKQQQQKQSYNPTDSPTINFDSFDSWDSIPRTRSCIPLLHQRSQVFNEKQQQQQQQQMSSLLWGKMSKSWRKLDGHHPLNGE